MQRSEPPAVCGGVDRKYQVFRPHCLTRAEQIRLLKTAGVDFLILETFFRLDEMLIALDCAAASGLPIIATMTFRPSISKTSDDQTPENCAKAMRDHGALAVGSNCEQEPGRMIPFVREFRRAVNCPIAAQPAAFRTSEDCHCFTRQPAFPDDLETIQISRRKFFDFGKRAQGEGISYVGGCCGCNAAYLRAQARGLGRDGY